MPTEPESNICLVSGQTHEEERLNSISSFIGLVLSLIGGVILIIYASFHDDFWRLFGVIIYVVTLVLMYTASAFYHGCKTVSLKKTLRFVDHSCIYLLIAGTYSPFTLGPFRTEDLGMEIFIIQWLLAAGGIIFKFYHVHRYRIISTFTYLAMGWCVIFSWQLFSQHLSDNTLYLLIAGGICYSLGTLFFLWRSLRWHHLVWHLFVLAGTAFHYFAVFSIT